MVVILINDDDNNNILVHALCKNTGQRTLQKKTLLRISKMKHISIERYLDLMARYKYTNVMYRAYIRKQMSRSLTRTHVRHVSLRIL